MDRACPVCLKEVGDAHTCRVCNKFIHIICGTAEGDEGYGQKATCNNCIIEKGKIDKRVQALFNREFFTKYETASLISLKDPHFHTSCF